MYSIDQEDLEEKLADPQTSMLILCNPHNPVGKIWDRETLERIGELCFKHHVLVLSDEIHCDITRPGMEYIPFASVSEHCKNNSITCVAPTKTFNLAGLQTAAVIVPDAALRHLSELAEFIRKESGLYVCDGREYGNGYGFLRMNLACRRELLKEGLERLKRSIHSYRKGISNGII